MKSYVKLEEVVKSLLIQMGEQTEHKYMMLLDMGIRGIKELAFDAMQEVRAVTLDVNSNLTVDLPCDYVKYRRIGLCGSDNISSLGLNAEMCLPRGSDGCGNPISRSSSSVGDIDDVDEIFWFTNYRNGEQTGKIYGLGGGQNKHGYYRIDREKNQIVLSSDFSGNTILLEYIGDGSGESGEYELHVYAEEALRAYIWWKYCQRKRNHPLQEKEAARRDWYNEKRLAIARFSSFNKEEALQASRKHNKQSPKF